MRWRALWAEQRGGRSRCRGDNGGEDGADADADDEVEEVGDVGVGRRSDLKVDLVLEVEEGGAGDKDRVYMFEMDEVVYDTCISVLH